MVATTSTMYAVERLTTTHTTIADGHQVTAEPLIEWLEQAVSEVVKRGQPGSNGAGVPIDCEALALLESIRRQCSAMRGRLFLAKRSGTLIEDVTEAWDTAWQARDRDELDDHAWAELCDDFERWAQRIDAERDVRPRQMELVVPCPQCDTRWIVVPIDDRRPELGEDRKSAVVIEYAPDRAPVAQCRVAGCETMWVGWKQLAQLGFALNVDQDLAVLEACGISLDFSNDNDVILM